MTNKEVTLGIKLDSTFVKLLKMEIALSKLRDRDQLSPSNQLALTILSEACGDLEDSVHQTILPAWRPHFGVVSSLRSVAVLDA